MKSEQISVIIPLYNKEREIAGVLRSVLAQTVQPLETIVVDDGSTDGSAAVVERIAAENPDAAIKLIRQTNAGECAARNRAIAESRGGLIALLDADDEWESGFLAEITALRSEFPDCGLYSTAFSIVSHDGIFPADTPDRRGVVDNFFRDSAHRYISIPSASAIPRAVIDDVGGFPDGMKIAGDLYMWIKIARKYRVCFSPERLCRYSKVASNRSSSIYTPEQTPYSLEELYDPSQPEEYNEFVARAALGKALTISAKGGTEDARRAARFFAYTKTYRRTLWKVRVLNSLPAAWRPAIAEFYNRMAWLIARKGLN